MRTVIEILPGTFQGCVLIGVAPEERTGYGMLGVGGGGLRCANHWKQVETVEWVMRISFA